MAIRRSRQLSIVRVAITAGMAQAAPEISGMVPFPLSPKGRMILSIRKTTLLIYPLSSNKEIKKKSKAI